MFIKNIRVNKLKEIKRTIEQIEKLSDIVFVLKIDTTELVPNIENLIGDIRYLRQKLNGQIEHEENKLESMN